MLLEREKGARSSLQDYIVFGFCLKELGSSQEKKWHIQVYLAKD